MIVINAADKPASSQAGFGLSGNIPAGSGQYAQIQNAGYSTIAFHINPPSNGWVQFQGTYDGVNYSNFTYRQIGNDGYSQEASDGGEDFIGSIIGAKALRFVNATGTPNLTGSIVGTLSDKVAILEGIEHNAPPHKFGNQLFHMGFSITNSAVTNSGLYTPPTRHKFVVTYLSMGAASTEGANITFHEGSGTSLNPAKWIFTTFVKSPVTDTQQINAGLTTPYVAVSNDTPIYLTTDGTATVRGILHGYCAEN